MANTITSPVDWANHSETRAVTQTKVESISTINRFLAFCDSQAKNRTGWFLLSLMVQGVLFLPLPAVLAYYFGAPAFMAVITLGLFFANVIAGMGGAGMRVLLSLFAVSIAANLLLVAAYVL
jgi:hypothetical protein